MPRSIEYAPSALSPSAVAIGYAALGLIVLVARLGLGSAQPMGAVAAVAAVLASILLLALLARATMPLPVKAGLALGLVAVLLLAIVRQNLFATAGTERAIGGVAERTGAGRSASGALPPPNGLPGSPAASGARVKVSQAASGAGRWADAIEAALDRRLGGALGRLGFAIDIRRVEARDDGRTALTLGWAVESGGRSVRCGTLGLTVRTPEDAVAVLAASLEVALRRSKAAGELRC